MSAITLATHAHTEEAELARANACISEFSNSNCDHWSFETIIDGAADMLEEPDVLNILDHLLTLESTARLAEICMKTLVDGANSAGRRNKTQVVDWWLTKYMRVNEDTKESIIILAINWNRVKVLALLEQNGIRLNAKGLAVECAHAEVVYWLHERGYTLFIDAKPEFYRKNLEFIKWIHSHKGKHILDFVEEGIVAAANTNSLEMAQCLVETFVDTKWCEPVDNIYTRLDLSLVKWLEEEFKWKDPDDRGEAEDSAHRRWVNHTFAMAAEWSQLDVVEYLHEHSLRNPTHLL